jgi:pimeloyl-ACP methyl ester carboxylesterase
MRVLAEAGRRVIAVDLRGHGASDAPLGGYDIAQLAADAAATLQAHGGEPAAVVGWSLGGMTALRMAYAYPQLVSKVVMVASVGVAHVRQESYPFGHPAGRRVEASMQRSEHEDRIGFRRRSIGDLFKEQPESHTLDWLHRMSLQTPTWAASACLSTLLRTEQTNVLSEIRIPVSQVCGTHDPSVSVEGARWVQEHLEGRLIELDCGHYPMLECADDFDTALLSLV